MNWQIVIVAIIILLALLYVSKNLWLKAKSFSPKSSCATDCGCEKKSKL